MPDDDGYPTEQELERIRSWAKDSAAAKEPLQFTALMDYLRGIWWMPTWGFHGPHEAKDEFFDTNIRRYQLSTGGWSGNEDLIEALQQNFFFWSFCWQSSRRGGHYVFEIPEAHW
jgi:hypothetical protein